MSDAPLQASLHGVVPVQQGSFGTLQHSALRWSNRLRQACAVCHSLSMVNKASVAGLDVEWDLFKAVEARFLVSHPIYKKQSKAAAV